jgi:medium-chain acyl-[acyl-carrier-protein] hydrolase
MKPLSTEWPVWTEQIKICSYDVDFTHRATSATLCRYFLEAAWNHAEALGVGFTELERQSKFWVLSRLLLEVQHYPVWGSAVTLRTWPRGAKSLFAMRDFEIADGAGTPIAAGSSAWLVLDAASKRPQRLNKLMPDLVDLDGRAALGRDPEKLAEDGTWGEVYSATVRYTDKAGPHSGPGATNRLKTHVPRLSLGDPATTGRRPRTGNRCYEDRVRRSGVPGPQFPPPRF